MCHLTACETRVVCKVTVRVDVHRFQGEGDVGHGVVEGFDGEADRVSVDTGTMAGRHMSTRNSGKYMYIIYCRKRSNNANPSSSLEEDAPYPRTRITSRQFPLL